MAQQQWPEPIHSGMVRSLEDNGLSFTAGTNVLDQVQLGIEQHLEHDLYRGRFVPVVLGCVPWFTDRKLAELVAPVRSCIVMNKSSKNESDVPKWLNTSGRSVPKSWLDELHAWTLDGVTSDVVAAPYHDGLEYDDDALHHHDVDLGPVRITGYKRRGILLHAKVLVLGYYGEWRDADPYDDSDWLGFLPTRMWVGSANLTPSSRTNIELGLWSTDRNHVREAARFVHRVISISEPWVEDPPAKPTPQLVERDWSDPY